MNFAAKGPLSVEQLFMGPLPMLRNIFSFMVILSFLVTSSGCSLPKIVFLHDPLAPEEHDNLGRIYESQGKFDLATRQYREALKKDRKHVPSLLLLGDLSYRLKDYHEAESAYEKALKLQPENGDTYNNLCWVYLAQKKDLDKAAAMIQKALALVPDHRPYYLDTQGMIFLAQGRTGESVAALKQAVELLPKDQPAFLAEAYAHLAAAYRSAGDEANALEAERTAAKYSSPKQP